MRSFFEFLENCLGHAKAGSPDAFFRIKAMEKIDGITTSDVITFIYQYKTDHLFCMPGTFTHGMISAKPAFAEFELNSEYAIHGRCGKIGECPYIFYWEKHEYPQEAINKAVSYLEYHHPESTTPLESLYVKGFHMRDYEGDEPPEYEPQKLNLPPIRCQNYVWFENVKNLLNKDFEPACNQTLDQAEYEKLAKGLHTGSAEEKEAIRKQVCAMNPDAKKCKFTFERVKYLQSRSNCKSLINRSIMPTYTQKTWDDMIAKQKNKYESFREFLNDFKIT